MEPHRLSTPCQPPRSLQGLRIRRLESCFSNEAAALPRNQSVCKDDAAFLTHAREVPITKEHAHAAEDRHRRNCQSRQDR
jgi:hypothetical protein